MEIKSDYKEIYETAEEDKDFDLINNQNLQNKSFFMETNNQNIISDSIRAHDILVRFQRME